MTDCEPGPSDACRAIQTMLEPLESRKIVLLATATIHTDSLFVNGLFQNVFIIYKLLDSMGYAPILLVNEKPKDLQKVPSILRHTRMVVAEDIIRNSMQVNMIIEIAMSIEPNMRKFLRERGAKSVKLYLGNILNIDIETPIFYPGVHFAHHIVGEIDEIWVSPHYKQHYEYAGLINQLGPAKIAPYVWDPCILTLGGSRQFKWRPRAGGESQAIVILEPNISFQKCSLIPLLIVEQLYRKTKEDFKVILGNSEKLQVNPFFTKTILPTLELYKDGKIVFSGRNTITSIMNDYPSCIGVSHQWNNQYNYMTLEYLNSGFPIIHNAPDWSDAGYYYEGSSVENGVEALETVLKFHASALEKYAAGAAALQWRHSPYNPEVHKAWRLLMN